MQECKHGVVYTLLPLCYVITFQEPKLYVQALLEEYNKYHLMVSTSFNDDSGFLQALDKVGNQLEYCHIS